MNYSRRDLLALASGIGAASLMRGMRTLHVRQDRQAASALYLAERLSSHPLVARVLYPGLPQHPGHDIAARQMENGFGFMLSIQVSGGEAAAIAVYGGSLGGLIEQFFGPGDWTPRISPSWRGEKP